ncbi:MAG: hypothetical protein A3G34_09160 [Candidatus Lindowbacteria bacterium RIFCSPLOWO2_12_FULL_62_27]|nr:MAG: hypothetical protein A3G34_09160 [Candidatus Lindowbacteria bacterium RIFCSPLOWO2_12_FULL_62_27]
MRLRPIVSAVLVGLFLCLSPGDAHAGADTKWADLKKALIGQFNSGWETKAMSGPDSNGLYRYEVKLFPGSTIQYKYGVVLSATDTQIEPNFATSSGYREFTVPSGVDTIYVPGNWADTPQAPVSVATSIVGDGEVKLTWAMPVPSTWDVVYGGGYHVYYRAGAAGPPWTQADTQLIQGTTTSFTIRGLNVGTVYHFIITAVDAYDTPGEPATDTPAPPGPYTSTSAVVTDTPQGKVLVQFVVDMRQDIALNGRPVFGMGLGGNQSPLTWKPYEAPLTEIQTGIWSGTQVMQGGQKLQYKYVKNPGTSKQEWEGQTDEHPMLFRFDPSTWGLNATNVSSVYVRGSFNSFGIDDNWKMKLESDSVFRLVKSIKGWQTYKYFAIHTGASAGDWIPGGSDLGVALSDIPNEFVYGPDTQAVGVWITGEFDPWTNNDWLGSKADDFYKLTVDNRKTWRLTRNMPNGTHKYKFIIDKTNDGVKNGDYESGSDRTLEVTGNRLVTISANMGQDMMRVVDVWEAAGFAPPRTPVSITAISMDTKVLLSWRPSADFIVNSYNIYRDTSLSGLFPLIDTVPASAYPEYLDDGLTNGVTYYYKITAYDTHTLLESDYSSAQEGIPAAGGATARRKAEGQDTSVMIMFPAGTIPANSFVRVTSLVEAIDAESTDTAMAQVCAMLKAAEAAQLTNPLEWTLSENSTGDTDSLIYIIDVKSKTTGEAVVFADTPVRVTIPFTSLHQEYAARAGLPVVGYALYVLNETTMRWDLVPGSKTSPAANIVGAPRFKFSIFQVMALAGSPNNLNDMVAFPNPCYPNRDFAQRGDPYGDGRPGITFLNIPTDIEFIKIYTITGELVRTLDPNDASEYGTTGVATRMIWDLTNDHGRPAASGVYLFHAKSATSNKTGKVAVVR